MKEIGKKVFPFFILFLLGLVLIYPVLQSGFYPMHDDTQVARVQQMAKALSDGMFPVRWVYDLGYGYGYPIFNFYAPFAYYIGSLFVFFGLSPLLSTKLMIALPVFIVGFGMYYLAKESWGRIGGLASAILAMTAPYVAVNIFVRGAIAEYYAYSFIPFLFYFLYKAYISGKMRFVIFGALSFAAVILSHNLTAMILGFFLFFLCFLLLFISIRGKSYRGIIFIFVTLIFGVLLSGFYWLPALLEMSYTNVSSQIGGGADFRDHFVCLPQLWESPWGFGGSVSGCLDGMSYRLGKLHIFLFLMSMPLIFMAISSRRRTMVLSGAVLSLVACFFLLSVSESVWTIISPFEYIQYPWRFLSILSLSTAFIGGSCVMYADQFFKGKYKAILQGVFCLFVIGAVGILYIKLFQPQTVLPVVSDSYTNVDVLRFHTSKISDEYLPLGFETPEDDSAVVFEKVRITEGTGTITILIDKTQELFFTVTNATSAVVKINTAYFPAWHMYIDSQEVLDFSKSQGMSVSLPDGDHSIRLIFKQTPYEIMGNLLSVVGIIFLIIGIIVRSRLKVFL